MFFGKLAVGLAAASALVAALSYLMVGRGHRDLALVGRRAYYVFAACATGGVAYLFFLFITNDFRVEYVYTYSALADGLIYNIAGVWGGQQGTFLLWLALGSVIGLWLVRRGDDAHAGYSIFYFMLVQVFLLVVLLVRSPFDLLPGLPAGIMPADGKGLNPLLQDPWMAIHPPIVFSGFAATAVPFSLALGALTLNQYKEWVVRAQPWVTFSVIMLGTGLTMGGYWAYKVLGWGGYWAWDPVENSVIIPWFILLGLMHGLILEKREGSLRKSNLGLAMLAFILIMFGTFLTRSGVLADFSVHSFVDLGINGYLVTFMLSFIGLGVFWLGYRSRSIRVPEVNRSLMSREYFVFLAMLIFAVTAALVLVGTSAPLFTRLWGDASAVNAEYYNKITFPLGVALALLMGMYPYFLWRAKGTQVWSKIGVAALMAFAATSMAVMWGVHRPSYVILTFAGCFAFFGNSLYLILYFRGPWYRGASYLAHSGFGLLLIGVLISSAFSTSEKIELRQGDVRSALGYDLKYVGRATDEGSRSGRLEVAVRDGDAYFMAYPRFYWSEFNQAYMRKPHVMKSLFYDVYISPEEHYEEGENPADRFDQALELLKGQSKSFDNVEYTFTDFEIGSHVDGSDGMRVTALIDVRTYDGRVERIKPYLELSSDDSRVQGKATLSDGTVVLLGGIQADAGAILLEFERPGGQVQVASLLVLEVSTKPMVGLVWMGAVMTILGAFLALYYRTREAAGQEDRLAERNTSKTPGSDGTKVVSSA